MRPEIVLICLAGSVFAQSVDAGPVFDEIPMAEHRYTGGWEHFVGGGLAVFDCNGDDLPELFAAGGDSPATLFVNVTGASGRLEFDPVTPENLSLTGLTGAYPLDIDSDGTLDLALLSTGANRVMRGLGGCAFEPFDLGLPETEQWTTAFTTTWEAGQVLPTLVFGNYVDRMNPEGPFGTCDTHVLLRPDGGHYADPIVLEPGFCALSMLFSDWSRSQQPDLRVSNDRHYFVRGGAEQMWRISPDISLYTEENGWQNHALWGMGIASRDVTGDGLPDVYLSSMGDQRLQIRQGDGARWVDVPYAWGTAAQRPHTGDDGRPSTGWHTAFGDVQNDGLDDIFVAKGNVDQMPDMAMDDPNSLLIATGRRRWAEGAADAGVASMARGRGAALVDLNGDGLLDLAVVNRRAAMQVWQNVTEDAGHWLSIALRQPTPNVFAVGAWIEVETDGMVQAREITIGGGHAGGSFVPEHFGLGQARGVRARVIWPDGDTGEWSVLEPDRAHILAR